MQQSVLKKRFFLIVVLFITVSVSANMVELLNEPFSSDLGSFTLDEEKYEGCTYAAQWYIKSTDNGSYAINSANYQSTSRGASNCKLVSPTFDCAEMDSVVLTFMHTTYAASSSDADYLLLQVSQDGTNWTTLAIPVWPSKRWAWVECEVDLTAYKSETTQFRFVYISTNTYAPTWEIKNVVVKGTQQEKGEEYMCYYTDLDGLCGDAMLDSLHNLISAHTVFAYSNVWTYKTYVDIRDDGTIWDMYSNCSFSTSKNCTAIDRPECDCYNREHMLPKSWWGGSTDEPMYTDLHHIIPTDYVANTNRSAWLYDEVSSSTWSNTLGSKLGTSKNFYGETAFEPVDEYKGDIARTYFYMITCYKDKNFTQGGKGFKYFKSGTAQLNTTALNLLLKWHRSDSVSSKEKTRNEKVAKLQGNRNPFVDSPELVEYIWGKKKTTAYKCTGQTTSNAEVLHDAETWSDIKAVYTKMGENVSAPLNELPAGMYLIYNGRSYKKILIK